MRWASAAAAAIVAVSVAVWCGLEMRNPEPAETKAPEAAAPDATGKDVCEERLRKLAAALRVYADDHDGAFPVADTPDGHAEWLTATLEGVQVGDLACPTATSADEGYLYHCYRDKGDGNWPKWMSGEHIVTADSEPDTWLASDYLTRNTVGPHGSDGKAFHYACVDGSVKFHEGRPRDVYK